MRFSSLLAIVPLALAVDIDTIALQGRQSNGGTADECTLAMQAAEAAQKNKTSFSGQVALSCLDRLPFDRNRAAHFIAELRKYIQWHSTVESLKSPPKTYLSHPVDLMAGLDKLAGSDFKSQYEFDQAVSRLISSANDGHLYVNLCSSNMFSFSRDAELMAVSEDGLSAPKIYPFRDLESLVAAGQTNGTSRVSPIQTVNGVDVIDYLTSTVEFTTFQDPDARWNEGLWNIVGEWSGDGLSARPGAFQSFGQLRPDGGATIIKFANGSTWEVPTRATRNSQALNGTNAQAFWANNCLPTANSTASPPSKRQASTEIKPLPTIPPTWYGTPFIKSAYNQMNGYILDNDTAVMFIPDFATSDNDKPAANGQNFSATATLLVQQAISSGRKRLIIDVTGNQGGTITNAFDLLKLFFPSKLPYSATRFRRHPTVDTIALAFTELEQAAAANAPLQVAWRGQVLPDQQRPVPSLEYFLGSGGQELGVNISGLYANFNYTAQSASGAPGVYTTPIRGYGPFVNSTFTAQPYKPEDLLIVTDGRCVSTCTTFVNLMTNVGGVRVVSMGGRPRLAPSQSMGGVRGAQSISFETIYGAVGFTLSQGDPAAVASLINSSTSGTYTPTNPAAWPLRLWGTFGGVNFRNAYQEGADHAPLQFEYQASDCRLFYTARNLRFPATTWADAAKAIWGGGRCVVNSEGGVGSLAWKAKNNGTASSSATASATKMATATATAPTGTSTGRPVVVSGAAATQVGDWVFGLVALVAAGVTLL